jgi:hypothetical protein
LPSLAYRVISATVPTPKGDAEVGRLVVDGASERSVGDILAAPRDQSREGEAAEFLKEILAAGPVKSSAVVDEAGMRGIAKRTYERARENLCVAQKQIWNPALRKNEWWTALPAHAAQLKALAVEMKAAGDA